MGYLLIVTLPAPLIYYDSPSCNFILNWVTIHYVGVVALSAQHAAITAQSGGPWPRNGPAAVMTSGANGSWVASGQGGCRTLGEGPDRLDRWGWASCNYLARTRSDTLGEWRSDVSVGPGSPCTCCGMRLRWHTVCNGTVLKARLSAWGYGMLKHSRIENDFQHCGRMPRKQRYMRPLQVLRCCTTSQAIVYF